MSKAETARPAARGSGPRTPSAPARRRPGAPVQPEVSVADEIAADRLDTRYLESLIGYNARRAALAIIGVFLERMAPFELRPVDFSVLSLIHHNPGVTARQLCKTLGLLPPNMVGTINQFEGRGLIERRPHPRDRRAQGLHLTVQGLRLIEQAEHTARELESVVVHKLSAQEQGQLKSLLRKIYL